MSSRILSVTNKDLQDFRMYVRVWFMCNVSLDHDEFKGLSAFMENFSQTFEFYEYMNEPFGAAETILELSNATDGSLRVSNEHYQAYVTINDFNFADFLPPDKNEIIASIQKRFQDVLNNAILREEDVSVPEQTGNQGKQFLN